MLNTISKLLIVDDSEDERILLSLCLRPISSCVIVASLSGGQAVIDYFTGSNGYDDRERYPLPDVMLLDFRMPCVNGADVLAWLKTRTFPNLRVVMLSHSFREQEMELSLALGADLCLPKREAAEDARRIARFCAESKDARLRLS